MLSELSIRNVVLIDHLDISFQDGLTVLTGETGVGKSILLDALGLALGGRSDAALVKHGKSEAVVTASFYLKDLHQLENILEEIGIDIADVEGECLVLRRVIKKGGPSRGYLNDYPVSVNTLRLVGNLLIEVQGQFDSQGLMNVSSHRYFLDAFSGHKKLLQQVAETFTCFSIVGENLKKAKSDLEKGNAQYEFLRLSAHQLEFLDIEENEEERLLELRNLLVNAEKNIEAINTAIKCLSGEDGAASLLSCAQRAMEKVVTKSSSIVESMDRATLELNEAESSLLKLASDIELDSTKLDEVENRLSDIRGAARKHGVTANELPRLFKSFKEQLRAMEPGEEALDRLEKDFLKMKEAYLILAEELSKNRRRNAKVLEETVMKELPSIKLEKAKFVTVTERLDETKWNDQGIDRVEFEISTNPGTSVGALNKITSGGERSRLLLALRVALLEATPVPTLVFDEVDSGVGGAVASAVGERLQKLGSKQQLLVVTHSPQVAAKGNDHWKISKLVDDGFANTVAIRLEKEGRIEEIGRMLAGEKITKEALAAAAKLMEN